MAKKEKEYVFEWGGVKYTSFPETLNKALSLPAKDAKKFADGFMKGYRKLTKFADSNVGYMIGYYGDKERRKLHKLFNVDHPVFGRDY